MPHAATDHYDVVIIGSGAGGGTLAWKLAPSGKRILLLERGGYLPRERDNWDTTAVFLQGKYSTDEEWRDRKGDDFTPEQNYYVGGNTKFYGAALLRLRPEDFGEITHHGGVSPAWPLSYQDLEPWYTEAERLYFVHGQAGEDPTDGPRSADYPYPAVKHEPRIQQLHDDLVRLGLHPSHLPVGALLDQEADGSATHTSRCIRCDRLDGFPCLVDAKADSQTVCVDPALAEHPNLELVTNAKVERLETDAAGRRVSAVVATMADGSEARFSGDIVVASCGALNSALLLLRSAYPLGGIQMLGKSDGIQLRAMAPRRVKWGAKLTPEASLETVALHGVDFWLSAEDLPEPENRLTIDEDGTPRLALDDENNTEPLKRLRKKFESMLSDLGFDEHAHRRNVYLHEGMAISATAHQAGTTRFGGDPKSSVLDVNCKAHELDNLYVLDSGFFVSIGAVNPTLTIIANTLRVGEHLLERLR